MNMPGFTAVASLYKTSGHYGFAGTLAALAAGRGVVAQLRPVGIGSCMARCRPGDWQCLFDCLGFERDPFRPFPGR
jgi:hypothetical protein